MLVLHTTPIDCVSALGIVMFLAFLVLNVIWLDGITPGVESSITTRRLETAGSARVIV